MLYSVTDKMRCIKINNAIQAKVVHQYKNTKRKLLRVNAGIWFNKKCPERGLTPISVKIKISGNNIATQKTHQQATRCRINNEIKFLFAKKRKLNEQLYKLHLTNTNDWQQHWNLSWKT
jgi:hypothetical protein